MKTIELNKGLSTKVNDNDYEILNRVKWFAHKDKNGTYYAFRRCGKIYQYMHRVIMNVDNPKILVDHIDSDGLNNQRDNLRLASHAQNMQNRKSRKNSSSKYLGVYRLKIKRIRKSGSSYHRTRWQAQSTHEGVRLVSKRFKTEEEAALAYNELAKHHGEFARFNVIE